MANFRLRIAITCCGVGALQYVEGLRLCYWFIVIFLGYMTIFGNMVASIEIIINNRNAPQKKICHDLSRITSRINTCMPFLQINWSTSLYNTPTPRPPNTSTRLNHSLTVFTLALPYEAYSTPTYEPSSCFKVASCCDSDVFVACHSTP